MEDDFCQERKKIHDKLDMKKKMLVINTDQNSALTYLSQQDIKTKVSFV